MKNPLWAVALLLSLAACSQDPGSEAWCEDKKSQPKSEWSGEDAMTFARHCVFDDSTIGSEQWCDNLDDKPKGEWSANEATDYAKHCVL